MSKKKKKQALMKREKYKQIHIDVHFNLKKKRGKERNSPIKSGTPTELKEDALMPGMLLLCQLATLDRQHQEPQEQSEIKEFP